MVTESSTKRKILHIVFDAYFRPGTFWLSRNQTSFLLTPCLRFAINHEQSDNRILANFNFSKNIVKHFHLISEYNV